MTDPPRDRVTLSVHAISRYIERVKPHLTPEAAGVELHALLEHATFTVEPPDWLEIDEPGETVVGYAHLTDGICVPFRKLTQHGQPVAVTTMTRAGFSDAGRARINRAKAKRRWLKKQDKKRAQAAPGGPGSPGRSSAQRRSGPTTRDSRRRLGPDAN